MSGVILDELNQALELTRKMKDALQSGELDETAVLAGERDAILHRALAGVEQPAEQKDEIARIVREIVNLNNVMIEIGERTKASIESDIKSDIDRELHASSGIKKYIDNMPDG